MNTVAKFAVVCILFSGGTAAQTFQLGSPFETSLSKVYRQSLKEIVMPADELPLSCQLATEIRSAPIFPATTNPFVTDDAQLIDFVSLIGFGEKHMQHVDAALSALYFESKQEHELGIWGLRFSSPTAAAVVSRTLTRGEFLRKGALLLAIWSDSDVDKSCQQAITDHLLQRGFDASGTSSSP